MKILIVIICLLVGTPTTILRVNMLQHLPSCLTRTATFLGTARFIWYISKLRNNTTNNMKKPSIYSCSGSCDDFNVNENHWNTFITVFRFSPNSLETLNNSSNTLEIILKQALNTNEIVTFEHLKKNNLEIPLKHSWNTHEISLKHSWNTLETLLKQALLMLG